MSHIETGWQNAIGLFDIEIDLLFAMVVERDHQACVTMLSREQIILLINISILVKTQIRRKQKVYREVLTLENTDNMVNQN